MRSLENASRRSRTSELPVGLGPESYADTAPSYICIDRGIVTGYTHNKGNQLHLFLNVIKTMLQ